MGLLAGHSMTALAAPTHPNETSIHHHFNQSGIHHGHKYHGEYYDGSTGTWFDLYSPDAVAYTNEDALASYWKGHTNVTDTLGKRGFYDCTYYGRHSTLKVAACGTGHAIGAFVSATGAAAAGGYIATELQEAFNGKRDNQSPRSICITKDGDTLCTSWANYNTGKLANGESGDIANFALKCGQSGGSAEFKATTTDGGIIYVCVSDRAKGCGSNVCGQ
jgi:hypothetical protein